jgi:hypothetical protein
LATLSVNILNEIEGVACSALPLVTLVIKLSTELLSVCTGTGTTWVRCCLLIVVCMVGSSIYSKKINALNKDVINWCNDERY